MMKKACARVLQKVVGAILIVAALSCLYQYCAGSAPLSSDFFSIPPNIEFALVSTPRDDLSFARSPSPEFQPESASAPDAQPPALNQLVPDGRYITGNKTKHLSGDQGGQNSTVEVVRQPTDLGSPANNSHSSSGAFKGSRPVFSKRTSAVLEVEFLKRREELRRAKLEIESSVSVVTEDPDLYRPLFLNVSKFRKSYELMEKIFRVYVYQEGKKPIFLTPALRGIYATEGWFMKLMIENKHFVVENPNKAHMFYLPYSVEQLVAEMYVPNSRTMEPLSNFLRDYVNMISAKYPFWNRTHGADHFYVSCHDWGPYTTVAHKELKNNTVKVLCNADLSEGYFVTGRDVSLPQANLHRIKQPESHLGGKPALERPILAFFAGNMHGRVRPILLQHWQNKDEDMKIYEHIPVNVSKKMSYMQHMKSSKYCICPKGYEVNSPRIVEAIYYECVPVIISDNFVPPLNEVLNWSAFSLIVAEREIPRLKDILLSIPQKRYITMQLRVKKLQRHFLFHRQPVKYDLFHMILHSIWFNNLNQIET